MENKEEKEEEKNVVLKDENICNNAQQKMKLTKTLYQKDNEKQSIGGKKQWIGNKQARRFEGKLRTLNLKDEKIRNYPQQ